MTHQINHNLKHGLEYLREVLQIRLQHHFGGEKKNCDFPLPTYYEDDSPLSRFIRTLDLRPEEYILLLLALTPHVYPSFFEELIAPHLPKGGDFSAFGGAKGENHRGLIPTGETALFVLAGNDLEKRLNLQHLFSAQHVFAKSNILSLESVKAGEPRMSGRLLLDPEYVELFTLGTVSLPVLSTSFPAQHIETQLEWEDLVLNSNTRLRIKELEGWIRHNPVLMKEWDLGRKVKPGYRVLFYGPPGTGKTLTATLLGKATRKEVFRIDLSMVVSKYIGETEKNLSQLFDKAHAKDWILFFDEADALFSKRTSVRDAHDKYANQEVAYLLQRIENYPGLTILATNFKSNIDDAFTRRFQALVHFPKPDVKERLLIWKKNLPEQLSLGEKIDLEKIARDYELTGSNIMNIIHFCSLQALAAGKDRLTLENLLLGIRREFQKEGKTMK